MEFLRTACACAREIKEIKEKKLCCAEKGNIYLLGGYDWRHSGKYSGGRDTEGVL